ncbi:MAG: hypothetical protein KJ747_01305 [Actinobacteria bacterium]|nr:hypothetical protein [Actinomycetota bacterium]MCG2806829.1 hypothetical protein [Coriobacteriia bacterium]
MNAYEKEDVYRIVAAEGGVVRVLMPGGLGTTGLEECYPSVSAAAAAIADAIRDGMPALEVLDETTPRWPSRAVHGSEPE